MPPAWHRVEEIFHAALARPSVERDAFLASACGEDEALRREVLSLLAQEAEAKGLLEAPALGAAAKPVTVATGSRLGPYEIVGYVGAGGMGEVYRARDTRLGRMVAIKVLPPELATDAEFRSRFGREAKAISALSHPHICALHDVGSESGTEYLVLELLEGETLAERLRRGSLPLEQVLQFGVEIADALAAAHQQGIVHRDLKPANVMLTRAGTKLLDFGLAKQTDGAFGRASSTLETAGGSLTVPGAIVGTLAYMSPEQAQGLPADARTDVFALGLAIYEMATGLRAFEAPTRATLLAKVLTADVPAVSAIVPGSPPALDHVVLRCLAKEPAERWQAAQDVKLELQWVRSQLPSGRGSTTTPPRLRRGRAWLPWVIAAGASAALTGMALRSGVAPAPPQPVPARFEVALPDGMRVSAAFDRAELSPDGRRLVLSASLNGRPQLFVRELGGTDLVPLEDTESAFFPFWSPDSRSVAFFSNRRLKRIPVSGGRATDLADATGWLRTATGPGTWAKGTILFARIDGSVVRVPDTGGTPTPVLAAAAEGGSRFCWPRFLPDGGRFLVSKAGDPGLYVASLDEGGIRRVAEDGSRGVYAAGWLLYPRADRVYGRPFDPSRLAFAGPERLLARPAGFFSASETGTVVYGQQRATVSRPTWFDREGRRTGFLGEPAEYLQVALSPRGARAAFVRPQASDNMEIWEVDLRTGIGSAVVRGPAMDSDPSWSPDEQRLAFTSSRLGWTAVFLKDLKSGAERRLAGEESLPLFVDQWTPDGRFVICRSEGRTVWAVPTDGDHEPRKLFEAGHIVDEVHVSPDGRWVAYNADESGRWEVYVARFPEFTSRRQVSRDGGFQPQWSGNGRELFYVAEDGAVMSLRVTPEAEPVIGPPLRLFAPRIAPYPHVPRYAVSADGQRFLALEEVEAHRETLTFLVNWLGSEPAAPVTAPPP
jgi:serine/threonine protein kinase/Tol biopolymer transport system component